MTTTEQLERLKNYSTRYELIATHSDGRKVLVGYTPRRGRSGLFDMLTKNGEAWVRFSGAENITFIPDLHLGFAGHFNERFQNCLTDSIRHLLVIDKIDGALSSYHRATMFPHGRSSLLTGLGFGCVGLASVCALVSPLRIRTASYHSICVLLWEIFEDFKLRHYRPLGTDDLIALKTAADIAIAEIESEDDDAATIKYSPAEQEEIAQGHIHRWLEAEGIDEFWTNCIDCVSVDRVLFRRVFKVKNNEF